MQIRQTHKLSLLKQIFLEKCAFARRFKGLTVEQIFEILNSNTKPDKFFSITYIK